MANVKFLINDKEIPLNEFAKEIIVNVNLGIIDSLKKIPVQKNTIKIEIEL